MYCHSAVSYFPVRTRRNDRFVEDRTKILPYIASGNWLVLADYDWNWELTVKTEQELVEKAQIIFFLGCVFVQAKFFFLF